MTANHCEAKPSTPGFTIFEGHNVASRSRGTRLYLSLGTYQGPSTKRRDLNGMIQILSSRVGDGYLSNVLVSDNSSP